MTHGLATELAPIALEAARAGALAIEALAGSGNLSTAFKSASHDLVTAADQASEREIIAVIRSRRPDDAVLGEESGQAAGATSVQWFVDPLDGTANFVYGRVDYAVSVGVRDQGKPAAGVVIRPRHGDWIAAGAEGVQAGLHGDSTTVRTLNSPLSRDVLLAHAMVAIGQPYPFPARQHTLAVLTKLVPDIRAVRMAGSAACDLAGLALGESDGFVGFGLAEWDTAAGEAIVLRAGGKVTRIPSGFTPNPILIAGSPRIVDALTARITPLLPA